LRAGRCRAACEALADLAERLGIRLDRHRELVGRGRYLWSRRAVVAGLGVVVVAGLGNLFGQRPQTRAAAAPALSLAVYAPLRVRSGDLFTARFHIYAHAEVKQATLILDPGWFEDMTFNGSAPQASQETSADGRASFQFGDVKAGSSFIAFLSFQVNPTNVGHRAANVELDDGSQRIAVIHRSLTIWP
jgi:hypothetical protein